LLVSDVMSTFVWHDLMTTDAERVRGFYGELFGWRFEPVALGPLTAYLIVSDGARLGTIMPEPSLPASHWMPYLAAPDVDAACERVATLGGGVCMPPVHVAPLGRFAIAGDPQGGWFSLLERPADEAGAPPAATRFAWDELVTHDPPAAATFYAVLLGWIYDVREDGGAVHRAIRAGDRAIGAIRAGDAGPRPAWIPSIAVDEPAAIAARARRLGATDATPGVLADPTGARFALRARAA
jgi:predicted enzyme related to lactoylglutathione lyase